jgi:hypothetical protein
MHSRATDRRSVSKCQGNALDQFGLSEVLAAVSTMCLILQDGWENAYIDARFGIHLKNLGQSEGGAVLKAAVKQVALDLFPDATLTLLSIRSRRFIERQTHELGLDTLARQISRENDGRVPWRI